MIGASAWLLGAVAATAGSLLAVDQLGQGILAQQSAQLTVGQVDAALAMENSEAATPRPSTSPTAPAAGSTSPSHVASQQPSHSPSPSARQTHPAPSTNTGRLLASSDGSVVAICETGGAYLITWSPSDGFEAEQVVRGPRPVARIIFRGANDSLVMHVSCRSGRPVAHISPWRSDDGGGDGGGDN